LDRSADIAANLSNKTKMRENVVPERL